MFSRSYNRSSCFKPMHSTPDNLDKWEFMQTSKQNTTVGMKNLLLACQIAHFYILWDAFCPEQHPNKSPSWSPDTGACGRGSCKKDRDADVTLNVHGSSINSLKNNDDMKAWRRRVPLLLDRKAYEKGWFGPRWWQHYEWADGNMVWQITFRPCRQGVREWAGYIFVFLKLKWRSGWCR